MPNNQQWDTRTANPANRVATASALTAAAVPAGGGGGSASGSGIDVAYTGQAIGDTLTITTSTLNFGAKPTANPLWYVDPGAEGVLSASPLSRLTTSLAGTPLGNLDTTVKDGPNGAARVDALGTSPDWLVSSGTIGPSLGAVKTNSSGNGDHIVIFCRHRRNFDGLDAYAKWQALNAGGSAWNLKRWRWWSEVGSPKNNMVFAYGQQNAEDGDNRITPEQSATGTNRQAGTDTALFGMKKDQWISEVIEIKQSSAPGVADGFVRHIADGQEHLFSNVVTRDDDANDGSYVDLVMEQLQFIYTDVTFSIWYDHVCVQDSPYAVILTDKPTWGEEGALIDPAIDTAWASQSITAQRRCAGARYLYLMANGTILNTNGVLV